MQKRPRFLKRATVGATQIPIWVPVRILAQSVCIEETNLWSMDLQRKSRARNASNRDSDAASRPCKLTRRTFLSLFLLYLSSSLFSFFVIVFIFVFLAKRQREVNQSKFKANSRQRQNQGKIKAEKKGNQGIRQAPVSILDYALSQGKNKAKTRQNFQGKNKAKNALFFLLGWIRW